MIFIILETNRVNYIIFISIIDKNCIFHRKNRKIKNKEKREYNKQSKILNFHRLIITFLDEFDRLKTSKSTKDVFNPLMVIDLLAILPFYFPFLGIDLRILRTFRLLRILRMFKLVRYFDALQMIGNVIYPKRIELISIFGVLIFLMFISSFLMFYAESEAQPQAFHNILDTFWWSLVTFTTVGYGDVYPLIALGKVLSGLIVLIGIMLFTLPTSILTAEFMNEFQNYKENL